MSIEHELAMCLDVARAEIRRLRERAEAAEAERDRLREQLRNVTDARDEARAVIRSAKLMSANEIAEAAESVGHMLMAKTGDATPVIRDHVGPLVSQAHEAVNLAIERDRLRAVVEAARVQCAAADAFWGESFTSGARRALNDADEALRAALAALDAPEPEA